MMESKEIETTFELVSESVSSHILQEERQMRLNQKSIGMPAMAMLICAGMLPSTAVAQLDVGTVFSYAVLGGSTVTNTGPTIVNGDLGIWPGNALTGFPPGIVNGAVQLGNAAAQQAQADALVAYNTLAGMAPTQNLTGTDLGGLTLTPGVYFFSSSAFLTGTLTLDAQGDPDAEFIFQIGSTLISASDASVEFINGGFGCNLHWQVGSSATLGTGTEFAGNIFALTSITLTTDASIINGRALALNGAVTMDSNYIEAGPCIPAPGVAMLLGPAFFGIAAHRRRKA